MKKILLSLIVLTLVVACGKSKEETAPQEVVTEQVTIVDQVPADKAMEAGKQSAATEVSEEMTEQVVAPNPEVAEVDEVLEPIAN